MKCSQQISLQVVTDTSLHSPTLSHPTEGGSRPATCRRAVESPRRSSGAAEWFEPCEVLAGAGAGSPVQTGREGGGGGRPVTAAKATVPVPTQHAAMMCLNA